MKLYYSTILLLLLSVSACRTNDESNGSYLTLKTGNPYQLTISNFQWKYSNLTGTLDGDFDVLDKQVFDLLKGKEGMCEVYLSNHSGNTGLLGMINIQHINDAPNWLAWRKRGVFSMLSWKIKSESQQADSTVAETYDPKLDTIVPSQSTLDTTKSIDQSVQSEADSTVVESN